MATAEVKEGVAITPVEKFVHHLGTLPLNVAETLEQFGGSELSRVAKKFGRAVRAPAIEAGVLRVNVSTVDAWMPYTFTFIERELTDHLRYARPKVPLRYACEVPNNFLDGRAPETLILSGEVPDVLAPFNLGPKRARSVRVPLTGNKDKDLASLGVAVGALNLPRKHGKNLINTRKEVKEIEGYRLSNMRWKRQGDPAMEDLLKHLDRLHTPFTETEPGVRTSVDDNYELAQRRYYGLVALVDCLVKRGTKHVVVNHMGPVNPAIDAIFLACANLTPDVNLEVICPTVGESDSQGTTRLWTLYATTMKLSCRHFTSLAYPGYHMPDHTAGLREVDFHDLQQMSRGVVHPFAAFAILLPSDRLAPERDPQHVTLVSYFMYDLDALQHVMLQPGKKHVVLVMQPVTADENFFEMMSRNFEFMDPGYETRLTLEVQWPHSQTGGRLNPLRLT